MARCMEADASVATVTPWCNAGEAAAFPRLGECAAVPERLDALARAACDAAQPALDLPAAVGHAVLVRGRLRSLAGGLDGSTYRSWYAALIDLSLRMGAFGARNVLCAQAYVAREAEGRPADGDLDRLAARWPHWNATLATFLMGDPLRAAREAVTMRLERDARFEARQRPLFGEAS
jgi:hypothetical protein